MILASIYVLTAIFGPTLGWEAPQDDTWGLLIVAYMVGRAIYLDRKGNNEEAS